jgi:CRISPR system Cascade subunit CasE
MLSSIREGMELAFRIRANPTKRVARKNDPLYGKRVGLLKVDEQIGWLIRKGQEREREKPGGFEILMTEVSDPQGKVQLVPRVDVHLEGDMKGRKKEREDLLEMTHTAVRFEGILRVTDAGAFRETLRKGIGSGKAYGFGLLSIAPVRK